MGYELDDKQKKIARRLRDPHTEKVADALEQEITNGGEPKSEFKRKLQETRDLLREKLNNEGIFGLHPPEEQEPMDFSVGKQCTVLCVPKDEKNQQKMYVYFDSSEKEKLEYSEWMSLRTIRAVPTVNDLYNFAIYKNQDGEKDIVFAQQKLPNEMASKHFYLLSYINKENLSRDGKIYIAGELNRTGSDENPYYLVNFQSNTYSKDYLESLMKQSEIMKIIGADNQEVLERKLFQNIKNIFLKKLNTKAENVQYIPGSLLADHIVKFDPSIFLQLQELGINSYFFKDAIGCELFKIKESVPTLSLSEKLKKYLEIDPKRPQFPKIKPAFYSLIQPVSLEDVIERKLDSARKFIPANTMVPEIDKNRFEASNQRSGLEGLDGITLIVKDRKTGEKVAMKTFHGKNKLWNESLLEWKDVNDKDYDPEEGTEEYHQVEKIYRKEIERSKVNDALKQYMKDNGITKKPLPSSKKYKEIKNSEEFKQILDEMVNSSDELMPLEDRVRKEAEIQADAAAYGAAPAVIGYNTIENPPFIVMRKLARTAKDVLIKDNWTDQDDSQLVEVLKRLDEAMINHNDPSPLNFMQDDNGVWYAIDFGKAKRVKAGAKPNNFDPSNLFIMFWNFNRMTKKSKQYLAKKMPKLQKLANQKR